MQFLSSLRQRAALFLAAVLPMGMLAASPELTVNVPGIGNFHQVDDHVYRGAQPTDDGFRNLAKLGIKTVVDLREDDARSVQEGKVVTAAGMRYIKVPMRGMQSPSPASVRKVLDLLEDTSSGPVFVHCMRGADRTGGVIACYRIEHDHWQNPRALTEARSLGMSWFEKAIQHYVLAYHPQLPTVATETVAAAK